VFFFILCSLKEKESPCDFVNSTKLCELFLWEKSCEKLENLKLGLIKFRREFGKPDILRDLCDF
jgi:hypothetical protein